VRNSGDQVRITAQLINTNTGAHEWSETSENLEWRSTLKSAATYDRILRGRHAADRWDKQGLDEAVTLFRQALDHDATSAEAAAQLALALESHGEEGFLPSAAASEQARHVADIAVKLDPKNPSAHFVLGMVHIIHDWDWAAADEESKQVSALAPSSAEGDSAVASPSVSPGRDLKRRGFMKGMVTPTTYDRVSEGGEMDADVSGRRPRYLRGRYRRR
jgi:adenylate cyclase